MPLSCVVGAPALVSEGLMHLPSSLRCGLSLCVLLHVSGLGVSPRAGALRGPPPWPLAQPSALLLHFSRAEFGPMPWASWSLRAPGAAMGVSQSVVGALQQCKITGGGLSPVLWGAAGPGDVPSLPGVPIRLGAGGVRGAGAEARA